LFVIEVTCGQLIESRKAFIDKDIFCINVNKLARWTLILYLSYKKCKIVKVSSLQLRVEATVIALKWQMSLW